MPKKCFFTINMLLRSDSNIRFAVDSIIGNEKFFIENVQLILIDSIGSELSAAICSEYTVRYPENIYFVDTVGKKPAECYNHAASLAFGTYISYMDNYGIYSKKALPAALEQLQSTPVPILCCKPLYSIPGEEPHPYVTDLENGTVRLHDFPDRFSLMLGAYFFKNTIVQGLNFNKELRFHYDTKFLLEALLKTHTYYYTDRFSYTLSRPTEREIIRYEQQYSIAFYTRTIDEFMIPTLKEFAGSAFVMSVMMYLIGIKFSLNADEFYKPVLVGSKVKEFFESCSRALKFIDDTVIMNKRLCRLCSLDPEMPFRFIRMKYHNEALYPDIDLVPPNKNEMHSYYIADNRMEAINMRGEFVAHVNNVMITRSKKISASILAVNADQTGLYFDAVMEQCSCLNDSEYTIYYSYNGKKSDVLRSKVYTTRKYFGEPFLQRTAFRFYIPFGKGKKLDTLCLYFRYRGLSFRLPLTFSGIHSRLSESLPNSYTVFGSRIMTYDQKNRSIVLRRATDSLLTISESKLSNDIGKMTGLVSQMIFRRLRYLAKNMIRSKGNKKILLFYNEEGINTNGNLLFRYFSRNKQPFFEAYICVRHDSPEKSFLLDAGYSNILDIGTTKAKATALAADYIFADDCDAYQSLGFTETELLCLRSMITARIVSIKNFFLTYQTAQFDNRLRDNTQLIFCASEKEKENLLSPPYDYDAGMIHVTGNPLLDAVSDHREKLLLFAPGERRLFHVYEHSSYYRFSDSAFFRSYSDILSDPSLIEEYRKKGWKIALLLPPSLQKYSSMFHSDDIVKLYPYTEQNEASLTSKASALVTDYSELQYRFAYCGKLVFYYFPPGLPVNSEHPGAAPSSAGYGPVLFEKEELLTQLKKGVDDQFRPSEKYIRRRNEFFGRTEPDKNNCKRIFEECMKYLKGNN